MARDQNVNVGGIPSAEAFGTVRLSMRNYFSTNFLWTALHTSRMAAELEASEGEIPRFDMAHRSYVVSSVIAAAIFLEAAINELFKMRRMATA